VLNKLNKGKNLKFGSIEISKLNKLDGLNTPLYKESYNEATMLFKECCEKNIEPSDGKNTLLQLTKNNPDGDITPVDGQIAFFLNRTGYNGTGVKSTVRVKLDSESKYGFEWNYKGEEYVLSAASVHSGKDASFGHYYTYKLEADGNWYEYNDSRVYKRTWGEIKSIIEKNGVMFTFTEKSAFEKSMQEYRSSQDTLSSPVQNHKALDNRNTNRTKLASTFENTRVCMAGIIGDYEVQSWERRAPLQLPSLEVIQTGEKKPYTGITDPNLLNKLSSKSNPIAIIDAANYSAQGGSGVDGAIFKAMAGKKSNVSCIREKIAEEFPSPSGHRIQTGGCIIHDSFGIKETSPYATHVIQAVGPRINDENSNTKNWEKELYSAYYNSFVLGISKGIKKFITAPISLGIFCSVTKTDEAKKVGEKAANILLHAINDASKFNKTGGNIEVYVTDHNPDDKSRNAAENAFIQALYKKFPSQECAIQLETIKAKLREFANHN
ncbi:MAG: macro domain-containing protein, partial [Acutalibacteraceae bacterium]